MRKNLIFGAAFAALAISLASCKGRTMENMEPVGETVDVVIPQADEAVDSAIVNDGEAI